MAKIETLHMGKNLNDSYLENVVMYPDEEDPDSFMFARRKDGSITCRLRNYIILPRRPFFRALDDIYGPRRGFRENLKFFRGMAGMSIDELSEASGVGTCTISRIECGGITNPSINVLDNLAIGLRVKIDVLVSDSRL